jgi:hypothetical protein
MKSIFLKFPITEQEYSLLDKEFGDLCEYQAWQLIKKNTKNNHTDEQTDIAQDLRLSLIRAGSYYKRQVYIEKCLELCKKYAHNEFTRCMVSSLEDLWKNKTRHGANRQKYGPYQEKILDKLVRKLVPKKERPSKKASLEIGKKFVTYCKAITWNQQKSMGKKITREKNLRSGQVSLSEYDYLNSEVL